MKTLLLSVLFLSFSLEVFARGPAPIPDYRIRSIDGDAALPIASVLASEGMLFKHPLGGKPVSAEYLEDDFDGNFWIEMEEIKCTFELLRHPAESDVIKSARCTRGQTPVQQSLALVVALRNAKIETTNPVDPEGKYSSQASYSLKAIACAGLVRPAMPFCKVFVYKTAKNLSN